jgi:hypothetical protein
MDSRLEISILTHDDKKKHISKLNIDSLLMDITLMSLINLQLGR